MKDTNEMANEGQEAMERMLCKRHHTVKQCFRLSRLLMASATFGLAIAIICRLGKLHCDVKVLKEGLR